MSKHKKTGLAPGTVIYTGNYKTEKVITHYVQYDAQKMEEQTFDSHQSILFAPADEDNVDWYDVRGMHDTKLIEAIGKAFSIHPIVLENAVDVNQRPSYEEYEHGNFITVKSISFNKETLKISKEHVGIYFRKGIIITFQETESDLFTAIRNRLLSSNGRIRQRGTDYLAYALVDIIVDHYYTILEDFENSIEILEEGIVTNYTVKNKATIHALKKELVLLKKSISPLREAISEFSKTESPFVAESSFVYIRNLYDHTIQVMDSVESYRDMLNSLQDLFIAEVSFKMNKVMQLLTLISVIFIPLTFLAGIYGMNFDNIPELHYTYGYQTLLGIMFVIFVIMLFVFRKKKWL